MPGCWARWNVTASPVSLTRRCRSAQPSPWASGVPLIYNRKESKRHGLGKDIEGLWQPGERVVIIEDVITTGGSIVSSVELFRASGLVVEDAVVLLDRQQGGVKNLHEVGIRVHSVLALDEVLALLATSGHIPPAIRQKLQDSDEFGGASLDPEQNGE